MTLKVANFNFQVRIWVLNQITEVITDLVKETKLQRKTSKIYSNGAVQRREMQGPAVPGRRGCWENRSYVVVLHQTHCSLGVSQTAGAGAGDWGKKQYTIPRPFRG